jgi:SOS response regulatory protein OraA/RecX
MRDEWRDLSDSELRSKLTKRGTQAATVDFLVAHREDSVWFDQIERRLNP